MNDTKKTVCDTEAYPPQTGDLLGGYIARLSARVRELEAASAEQSAYQRSLEDRIERLEAKQAEAPAVTTPDEKPSEFMAGFDGKAIRESMNVPPVCASCGHAEEAHKNGLCNSKATYVSGHCGCHEYKDEFRDGVCTKCGHAESDHDRAECWGGSLGKPCQCREFTPVTTPTVIRERTHGRYGTRNLTKSKKVCATCGHDKGYHQHVMSPGTWCDSGTLGKPCKCREFKP